MTSAEVNGFGFAARRSTRSSTSALPIWPRRGNETKTAAAMVARERQLQDEFESKLHAGDLGVRQLLILVGSEPGRWRTQNEEWLFALIFGDYLCSLTAADDQVIPTFTAATPVRIRLGTPATHCFINY